MPVNQSRKAEQLLAGAPTQVKTELEQMSQRYGLDLNSKEMSSVVRRALRKPNVKARAFFLLAHKNPWKAMQQEFKFYQSKGFKISPRVKNDVELMTRKIHNTPKAAFAAYKRAARHLKAKLRFQRTPRASVMLGGAVTVRKPGQRQQSKPGQTSQSQPVNKRRPLTPTQVKQKIRQFQVLRNKLRSLRKMYDNLLTRTYNPYYWTQENVNSYRSVRRELVARLTRMESNLTSAIYHLRRYSRSDDQRKKDAQVPAWLSKISPKGKKFKGPTTPMQDLQSAQRSLVTFTKDAMYMGNLEKDVSAITKDVGARRARTKFWGGVAVYAAITIASAGVGSAFSAPTILAATKMGMASGAIGGSIGTQAMSMVQKGELASVGDTLKGAAVGAAFGAVGGAFHGLGHAAHSAHGAHTAKAALPAAALSPVGRVMGATGKGVTAVAARAPAGAEFVGIGGKVGLKVDKGLQYDEQALERRRRLNPSQSLK